MTIRSFAPGDPEQLVAEAEEPSKAELERIVVAAGAAQPAWEAETTARGTALTGFAEALAGREAELVGLMVREVGKPVGEARAELARAVAILRYYAQLTLDPVGELFAGATAGTSVLVSRRPLGVVMAITPWNFPVAIPVWKLAPALAYGNTVIAKPAAAAIGVARALGEAAAEALPAGVLQVACISGARAGELLDDPRIAGATFTGSTEVGLGVAARLAARGAPAQAEMGGQNPAIVLPDADLDDAAAKIVAGAMSYSGQKCSATRRAIVVGAIADELESRIAAQVSGLVVGDPADEATVVGPLIDAAAAAAFERRVEGALGRGGRLIAAAEPPPLPGHFVAPTALALDDPSDEVNQEETFGPLLTVLRAADPERALAIANSTRFGLVGAVHGTDIDRAAALAARLDCGLQRVNAPTPGVDYYVPFGGEGASSFGPREQGRAAREFFTASRTLTVVRP